MSDAASPTNNRSAIGKKNLLELSADFGSLVRCSSLVTCHLPDTLQPLAKQNPNSYFILFVASSFCLASPARFPFLRLSTLNSQLSTFASTLSSLFRYAIVPRPRDKSGLAKMGRTRYEASAVEAPNREPCEANA